MAGALTLGKGVAPSPPSSGTNTVYVEGTSASSNIGIAKSLDASGVLAILSPNDRGNLLVNSGLWFALRQAAGTLATYSSVAGRAFGPDQWAFTNENASVQYIRVDTSTTPETGLQGRYYGSVTKITANGKIQVSQCLEADDIQAVRGRTVRFQVWMKATTNTTIRLGVIQLASAGTVDTIPGTFISAHNGAAADPTLGANLSYITPKTPSNMADNCTVNGNACDCSVTTAWQRFGMVVDVPANCKNIIVMMWSNAQIAIAAGFSWSQASLTDGFEIQDWNQLPHSIERLRCLRYYRKSFLDATLPAQNIGANTGEVQGIAGKAGAVANSGFIFVQHEPAMRIAPGVTLFNPQAANALMRNQTGAADMGATSATGSTANNLMINATGVAATAVGDQLGIHYTLEAGI